MGTPPLVGADIKDGRRVIDAVRKAIPVRRAFWAYFVGPEEWRLVIVTSLVDSQGPIAAYDTAARDPRRQTSPPTSYRSRTFGLARQASRLHSKVGRRCDHHELGG